MRLKATVGPDTVDLEVIRKNGRITAVVDGRDYDLEISEPEPNIYLIRHNGRVYEAFVSPDESSSGERRVSIADAQFDVRLIDPKRLRDTASDSAGPDGPAEIKTAMPGKIVRILVDVGEEVTKGQGIIVVEAMKMQNELKSPRQGVVKDVLVSVDATVSSGDLLVTIE